MTIVPSRTRRLLALAAAGALLAACALPTRAQSADDGDGSDQTPQQLAHGKYAAQIAQQIKDQKAEDLLTSPAPPATLTKGQQDQMREEEKIGAQAADDLAKSVRFVTDPAVVSRVQTVGAKIAAVADKQQVTAGFGTSDVYPFHYTYHVIDDKEINAFSIPGGHIYIYKGLLDELTTDDELAGVLGHETAHAAHHHISMLMHQQSKMGTQMLLGTLVAVIAHVPAGDIGNLAAAGQYAGQAILNNKYGESAEEDADHTGMIFMQKAGYNPVGMLAMLQRLKDVEDRSPDVELGFLRDHPLTSDRLTAAHHELSDLDVRVDGHSLREAAGTMLAAAEMRGGTPAAPAECDLMLGNQLLCRAAPSRQPEVAQAAARLNHLLDDNLQLYEVKAEGADLVAREQPLLQFTPADTAVAALPPPAGVADAATAADHHGRSGATAAGSAAAPAPPAVTVASAGPATPDTLATTAANTLRNLLWAQSVTGTTTEQNISVAQTASVIP